MVTTALRIAPPADGPDRKRASENPTTGKVEVNGGITLVKRLTHSAAATRDPTAIPMRRTCSTIALPGSSRNGAPASMGRQPSSGCCRLAQVAGRADGVLDGRVVRGVERGDVRP